MRKLMGIMAGIVFLFLPFMLNIQVFAAAPNVKDCIEGNADCEKLDGDSSENEEDAGDTLASNGEEKTSFAVDLIKMVFALVVVIGLIYALLKFLNKRNKLFSNVKAMENLGGISVGTNKSLQLVRIGSRVYVIGVGENVDMLQEITDEKMKQELLKPNESGSNADGMFTSLFSGDKKHANPDREAGTDGFKNRLTQELANLKETRQRMIRQDNEQDEKDE